MTPDVDQMTLDLLQRRAFAVGFYCNKHRNWNPLADSGGPLYLMEKRTRTNPKPQTVIKFATVEQLETALQTIERETFSRRA